MKKQPLTVGAKLVGGFLAVATLTVLVGVGGYWGLDRALTDADTIIRQTKDRGHFVSESVNLARSAQVNFKKQVQEWKDLLLRGKDPAAFTKHLDSFNRDEALTQETLRTLKAMFDQNGIDPATVEKARQDHADLGPKYREALKHFDPPRSTLVRSSTSRCEASTAPPPTRSTGSSPKSGNSTRRRPVSSKLNSAHAFTASSN